LNSLWLLTRCVVSGFTLASQGCENKAIHHGGAQRLGFLPLDDKGEKIAGVVRKAVT
jgi:hypothetical protein